MNRREFLLSVSASALTSAVASNQTWAATPAPLPAPLAAPAKAANATSDTIWNVLRVGAGGQLTGIDIAPDGTKVVKSDVGGAYIWNATSGRWDQLITALSMPAADVGPPDAKKINRLGGVWEISIAYSKTTRLYMVNAFGAVYRSDDRGATWTRLPLVPIAGGDPNGNFKFANQKMAVDPANPDHVIVGTPTSGVWRTTDAGATWAMIASIPVSVSGPGSAGIAFDWTSATKNGMTSVIYASSYGNGVWQSVDGGSTWTKIAGAGTGPSSVWTAQIGADGVYFCSDHANVWKYQKALWTSIRAYPAQTVCVDPNRAGRLILSGPNGGKGGLETLDNGLTWVGNDAWYATYPKGGQSQVANDIAWLATSDTAYMTIGDMKIDKSDGLIYFAEGIGVWKAAWPTTFAPFTWTSQSLGIEELVANDVICPPGGKPIVGVWDRGVFRISDPATFPTSYGTNNGVFSAGWALDYASNDPSFVATISNWNATQQSGYSRDGGVTWKLFAGLPAKPNFGGAIAAASSTNMVWVPANNGIPYYTKDGGATWNACPNLPADGWIFAYYLNSHPVAADRVSIGTFYLHNYLHGLYSTSDGGDTWTLVYKGTVSGNAGANNRLRAAPGVAGHLWFTAGEVGASGAAHPANSTFRRSINGGLTWTDVLNVKEVWEFGFGAPKVKGGYPSIYIIGWVNNVYGFWRSDDQAMSWTNIGKFPLDNLDYPKTINGDMNTYGNVYVGFSGTGFVYGRKSP